MKDYNSYQLCFVEGGRWYDEDLTLYFTEKDVKDQWGSDWDDTPYEHNAGLPYDEDTSTELGTENGRGIYAKIDIIKVILTTNSYCDLITPCSGVDNSRYSVKDINSKAIPWVVIKDSNEIKLSVFAGTTLKQFLDDVSVLDCVEVLVPLNRFKTDYSYSNTGVLVKNNNDGKIGVVLRENKSTGQVQVLEKIQPKVINTHDSWNTLSIIDSNE